MEEEFERLESLFFICTASTTAVYAIKWVILKQWPSNARWIHYLDILFYVLCWFASGGLIGMYLDFLCVYVCDQVHDVYTVYVVQQVVSVRKNKLEEFQGLRSSCRNRPVVTELAFWAFVPGEQEFLPN